jgi:hypothetical protein
MKIKDEYIGAKISHKGNRITLDANRYDYFVSIGLGYMFEEPTVSEPKVIKYKAVKGPIPTPVVEDEPTVESEEDGTEAE